MSFDIEKNGGYGNGTTTVSDADGIINTYFRITRVSDAVATYDQLDGVGLKVGAQVLIHYSRLKNSVSDSSILGKYEVRTVVALADDKITFDQALDMKIADTSNYSIQGIVFFECKNMTLNSGKAIKPKNYDGLTGGVLALKVANLLNFNGGHINLKGCGISLATDSTLNIYRPLTSQESGGIKDTDTYAGAENSITKDRLILNIGDGACFVMAKEIKISNEASRIGNPSVTGVQYCRGASDSPEHSGTNIGGSTILLACNDMTYFTPKLIAKYADTQGKGLARAYIAFDLVYSRTANISLLPDEGLYALDRIHNPARFSTLNIKSFGDGSNGSFSDDKGALLNSYATVSSINGKKFYYSKVKSGKAAFKVGAMVMIHATQKTSGARDDGMFKLATIVALEDDVMTLDVGKVINMDVYYVQLIAIPQFTTYSLSDTNAKTPQWADGAGGIFAIACSGTCDLSGGFIDVRGAGTFRDIANAPDDVVVNAADGNAYMASSLPIGQGHGSVFILARTLIMNTSTRIGADYDGSAFGGTGGGSADNFLTAGGGYKGSDGLLGLEHFDMSKDTYQGVAGYGGSGGSAGKSYSPDTETYAFQNHNGGWHSNAALAKTNKTFGLQGAHIFIVADTIKTLCLHALSTGGSAGRLYHTDTTGHATSGGCGYGGGGGAPGSDNYTLNAGAGGWQGGGAGVLYALGFKYTGGGSAGACFVYANNVTQDTTGLLT